MTFLSALLLATTLSAAATEELARISNAHFQLRRYDLLVEATFARDTPLRALRAVVRRQEDGRELRTFGDLTILETPTWRLAVDKSDRVIVVSRRGDVSPPASASVPSAPSDLLDDWRKRGAGVLRGEATREGQQWVLESPNLSVPRAVMVIDPKTLLLRRLDYEIANPGGDPVRVSIRYTWRDTSALKPGDFDESNFIMVDGDTVRPAEAYAGYEIIRSDRPR